MSNENRCTLRSSSGRWVLLATILASGAAFLAGTAVPVALPVIQAKFNTSFNGIQWVVNANLLSLGALILIGGALGDQYGRKRIFILGMLLFGLAVLFSSFAPSIGMLLSLQGLQGVGAALMVPQSLAIINDCFAESERGQAIGLWAGISGGIAALGPLAGGWLIDKFSWGAVFFMIVPVILAALLITLIFVPGIATAESRKLDWPGAVSIVIGLSGLIYGLMTVPVAGWLAPGVLFSLAVGMLATGLFIFIEAHQKQPLVYLRIFRNQLVAGANAVTLLVYFGLNGIIFFTVLNLQQIHNFSPTEAGLALLPPIVLITFLTWPTGALADKIGPRLQMTVGPLLVSAAMVLLAMGGLDADYMHNFLPGLTLLGIGMALVIPPLTKCALFVEPRFSGSASGINNGVARVAGLLAVAVLGIVVVTLFRTHLTVELGQPILTGPERQLILAQADKLGGIVVPNTFSDAARQQAQTAIHSAFIYGFRIAMVACAVLALGGALVSAITIKNKLEQM